MKKTIITGLVISILFTVYVLVFDPCWKIGVDRHVTYKVYDKEHVSGGYKYGGYKSIALITTDGYYLEKDRVSMKTYNEAVVGGYITFEERRSTYSKIKGGYWGQDIILIFLWVTTLLGIPILVAVIDE